MTNALYQIVDLKPEYGSNYGKGYIGFTYSDSNVISKGIAYFTRWARMSQIRVSHALIVTDENECIEAHMNGGVQKSTLSKYFDDPHCQIFFRKPVDLLPAVADAIVESAESQLGCTYDIGLIAGHALPNTFVGRVIERRFGGSFESLLCKFLNHDNQWICSELASFCLDQQHSYHDTGILKANVETISPQELFEDPFVFEAWKNNF
jgi:hypothetical protein